MNLAFFIIEILKEREASIFVPRTSVPHIFLLKIKFPPSYKYVVHRRNKLKLSKLWACV
jgi:hypothetical protein